MRSTVDLHDLRTARNATHPLQDIREQVHMIRGATDYIRQGEEVLCHDDDSNREETVDDHI
jgi:hypothetical protein